MRVGYGKIGRVIDVNPGKWGQSGGDNEPPALLMTLARRHPDVEWVVIGRNTGWEPPLPNITNCWQEWAPAVRRRNGELYRVQDQGVEAYYRTIKFYDELTSDTYKSLDGIIIWSGQHGTSNTPIPKVGNRSEYTKAQISQVHYGGHIVRGISTWRELDPIRNEEIWLVPDARNYVKARDLKWPRRHPILCQYDWNRLEWCERYGDSRAPGDCGFNPETVTVADGMWRTLDQYVGSGLELVGIPDEVVATEPPGWEERDFDFGMLINEARAYGVKPEMTRLHAMQHYALPLEPRWIHGTWSADSLQALGVDIKPIPYEQIFSMMSRTKATLTTPSSGSRWATAKPWESFATGVICFFHPFYDTQDHILLGGPDHEAANWVTDEQHALHAWLRVKDPDDLAKKVKAVTSSRETYEWLAAAQRRHLVAAVTRKECVRTIERRLGL
jgi:hypothetical protein